jgi:hypothetical protein
VISGADCCDSDALANPDQTAFQATENACGSFDYNCNNDVENLVTLTTDELGAAGCAGLPVDSCQSTRWSRGIPACGVSGSFVACGQILTPGNPLRCASVTGGALVNQCR